jgi:hypothetical protein
VPFISPAGIFLLLAQRVCRLPTTDVAACVAVVNFDREIHSTVSSVTIRLYPCASQASLFSTHQPRCRSGYTSAGPSALNRFLLKRPRSPHEQGGTNGSRSFERFPISGNKLPRIRTTHIFERYAFYRSLLLAHAVSLIFHF